MKKIFLATSFSGQVDAQSGKVLPELRAFIEALLVALRKDDMAEVFCAAEYEDWMIAGDAPPEVGVQKDLQEIDAADVVVALMHAQLSAGVQFELGYAVAKSKHVILVHHAGQKLTYFNQGAVSSGLITQLAYDNLESLIAQLTIAVHAPADDVPA